MKALATMYGLTASSAKRGLIVLVLLLAGVAGAAGHTSAAPGVTAQHLRMRTASGTLRQYVHVYSNDWPFQCQVDESAGIDVNNNLDYSSETYCPLPTSARITWQVQVYDAYNDSWGFYDSNGPDTCASDQQYCASPSDGTYYETPLVSGESYRLILFVSFCGDYCDGSYTISYFNP